MTKEEILGQGLEGFEREREDPYIRWATSHTSVILLSFPERGGGERGCHHSNGPGLGLGKKDGAYAYVRRSEPGFGCLGVRLADEEREAVCASAGKLGWSRCSTKFRESLQLASGGPSLAFGFALTVVCPQCGDGAMIPARMGRLITRCAKSARACKGQSAL